MVHEPEDMLDRVSFSGQLKAIVTAALMPAAMLLVLGSMAQVQQGFSLSEFKALLMAAGVIALPVSLFAIVVIGLPVAWALHALGWFRLWPVVLGGGVIGLLVFHVFIAHMATSFGGPAEPELGRRLLTWLAGAVAGSLSAWVYWMRLRRATGEPRS